MWYHAHGEGAHFGAGHWFIMLVLGIAFIALVAAAVVAAVRYAQSPKSPSTSTSGLSIDSPENLLKMRLARGEINEDEYRSRMAALSGS